MGKLNFAPEPFGNYNAAGETSGEIEGFLPRRMRRSGGSSFGSGSKGSWRRRRRWAWLSRSSSGGASTDSDNQPGGSIRECLSQVTGVNLGSGRRFGFRRAVRKFQRQQQLPPTGRLDADTRSALRDACDSGGNDDDDV